MDKRTRDGHALHLTARKLVRIAIAEAFKLHPRQPFPDRFPRVAFPGEEQWQFYVFEHCQRVQQLKRLKNEANLLAPKLRQTAVFQRRGRNSVHHHLTGRRKIHGSGKIEQCRLSAATAPHQRHKFAALNVQRKTTECMHWLAIRQIVFRDILQRKYRH